MTDPVSKLHHIIDCARKDMMVSGITMAILNEAATLPIFILDSHLLDVIKNANMLKSLIAMEQMGMMHLPYPKMCLELWENTKYRYVIVLEEVVREGKPAFLSSPVEYLHDTGLRAGGGEQVVNGIMHSRTTFLAGENGDIDTTEWLLTYTDEFVPPRKDLVQHIGASLTIAVLCTHIAGIERKKIAADRKLNVARAKHGKSPVRDHVTVRIGHVYDRDGKAVKVTGKGSKMPIHMRAGYVRNQQHGAGWMEEHPELAKLPGNTDTHHKVWIAPVLVNFDDGTNLPLPKNKLVTF